jgi:hypothetical protein
MTDVFVVDVYVNKAAQCTLVVEEMAPQLGVQRRQAIQRFAGRGCFNLDLSVAAGKMSQRCRNIYRD